MNPEFWQQRWREGRIGFHRPEVMPLLQQHWTALKLPSRSRVLVPLCGKSLDILWLAEQGHEVLGVEISELAVAQFFAENGLNARQHTTSNGIHHRAGAIEVICGDAFALDDMTLSTCSAIYDRAAMIALPPALRQRYVETVYSRLPIGCQGLLITLAYPQSEKSGPPFSVDEPEVRARFAPNWRIERLDRRNILAHEPDFGVSTLHTEVYDLRRER